MTKRASSDTTRRGWLAKSALGAGALGAAWLTHHFWGTVEEEAIEAGVVPRARAAPRGPHGPLRPDPGGILDLPEGFTYRVIDRRGDPMDDGFVTPGRYDGMACFDGPTPGTWTLLRNHENGPRMTELGPAPDGRTIEHMHRPGMPGGVTRVVLDAHTLAKRSATLVLAGTILNCAGGPSPWGWLSCEEAIDRGHGYVFVCDPLADRVAAPRSVPAFGRFRHEAACVDPARGIVYLTEDREGGCLYRFVPHDPSVPFEGTLQAMRVRGRARFRTDTQLRPGDDVEIDWVPIADPDPDTDTVRVGAQRDGAAIVRRGEGIAFTEREGRPSIVLSATEGGRARLGQILRLDPEGDGGTLSVIAESSDQSDFDMPDNLVVSPHGHVYFCEDGHARNYVRGLGPDGRIYDVARNRLSRSELVGVCFSPDGSTMFVGIQQEGVLLGVRGPWPSA
jgi:hypothetical protein